MNEADCPSLPFQFFASVKVRKLLADLCIVCVCVCVYTPLIHAYTQEYVYLPATFSLFSVLGSFTYVI